MIVRIAIAEMLERIGIMFKKNRKVIESYHIYVDDPADTELIVDKATYDYINKLKEAYFSVKKELDAITPIIDSPNFTPAISKECADCKYVIFNPASLKINMLGEVIHKEVMGCRRNSLCEDFVKREE